MRKISKIYDYISIQWNPACETTPFASKECAFQEGWPLVRGRNQYIYMFRFTLSSCLSRGGGLSSGWPLKRGSSVLYLNVV